MSDYKSTFKDPMYWVSVGVGLGAIGLAVSQTRRGSAGRLYKPYEWLDFFVEPKGEVDDSLRAEGAMFSDKANEVYNAWAESRGVMKSAYLVDHVRPSRDSVAYHTFDSITGHGGGGLWDGELFTGIGIPRAEADMLGASLDRFVNANAELSRLGNRLDDSISTLLNRGK